MLSAMIALLSLIAPMVMGCFLIRLVWPESHVGLRIALGTIVGSGLCGLLFYLALAITESVPRSFIASEVALLGSIVAFALPRMGRGRIPAAQETINTTSATSTILGLVLVLIGIL